MKPSENIVNRINYKNYKVAIYLRLSKEDLKLDDKIIEEDKRSESILNQKNMLLKFIKDSGYELFDIYIDDDYTGQNYDRPDFKRMIEDIEHNKVNMVITKDLSRLGRDYIETGEYVEKWFPKHNVRYIAVNDGVDTFLDNANNDIAPFKLVINDMYSRDNSKKIRSALRTRQEQGLWVGGCPPFGYKVDDSNRNKLIINEEEAPIVRKVFNLALEGNSKSKIAQILFDEKIPTPSMVRKVKKVQKYADLGYWNTTTIKAMLTNVLYTGDLVQNKRSRISYKVRNIIPNEKSEWIIVSNTHEAIIDKESFNEIQNITKNCKGFQNKKDLNGVLDGIIYCGECQKKIGISGNNQKNYYTYCYTYRKYSKLNLCTSHCTNFNKLEKEILNQLKIIIDNYIDNDKTVNILIKNINDIKNGNNLALTLKRIEHDLVVKEELLDKIYLDKLEDRISKEMYNRLYLKLINEVKNLKNKRNIIAKNMLDDDIYDNKNKCIQLIQEFLDMTNPSRDLILRLIKKIEYFQNKTINIHFNFKQINN